MNATIETAIRHWAVEWLRPDVLKMRDEGTGVEAMLNLLGWTSHSLYQSMGIDPAMMDDLPSDSEIESESEATMSECERAESECSLDEYREPAQYLWQG